MKTSSEKNVPIPRPLRKRDYGTYANILKLDIGDVYWIEIPDGMTRGVYNSASQVASRYKRQGKGVFTVRKILPTKIGIWRIK